MTASTAINAHPARYSAEEWALRVDLAAAYRVIAHLGWDDQLATHISVRLPGPEHHFLINPLGLLFEEITASCLLKVDLDGNLLEPSENIVNRAGFIVHSSVHLAAPQAMCAVHLHTVAGTAVSIQKDGLLPLSPSAMILHGKIGYHDFEGVTVRDDERARLGADLSDNWALILRNHGTLTVGVSIAEAMQRMYLLERACQMQIAAQSAGGPLIIPDRAITDEVKEQRKQVSTRSADIQWAALRRKMDRVSPGYDA
ncbi:MAG: class II aldolase/adducin family protein [Rhodocyclaceae bacterium]|jgi:ribulose-5-phosphate 4-epimerase/fuculose-1-phosphate aldolase|nr:class II aldolase/adducin family protein [Rhodocyclaceae bacterium]